MQKKELQKVIQLECSGELEDKMYSKASNKEELSWPIFANIVIVNYIAREHLIGDINPKKKKKKIDHYNQPLKTRNELSLNQQSRIGGVQIYAAEWGNLYKYVLKRMVS